MQELELGPERLKSAARGDVRASWRRKSVDAIQNELMKFAATRRNDESRSVGRSVVRQAVTQLVGHISVTANRIAGVYSLHGLVSKTYDDFRFLLWR